MPSLPIESYPELLQEYGRAFALSNHVESTLDEVLLIKGGLASKNPAIGRAILDETLLGKKIKLAENILPSNLSSDLWKLNSQRILMAHGVASIDYAAQNPTSGTTVIVHKQEAHSFTVNSLKETSELARELRIKLMQEIFGT